MNTFSIIVFILYSYLMVHAEKKYEVRKVNDNTYYVTTLTTDRNTAKYSTRSTEIGTEETKWSRSSDMTLVIERPQKKKNISGSDIAKAREFYFKNLRNSTYVSIGQRMQDKNKFGHVSSTRLNAVKVHTEKSSSVEKTATQSPERTATQTQTSYVVPSESTASAQETDAAAAATRSSPGTETSAAAHPASVTTAAAAPSNFLATLSPVTDAKHAPSSGNPSSVLTSTSIHDDDYYDDDVENVNVMFNLNVHLKQARKLAVLLLEETKTNLGVRLRKATTKHVLRRRFHSHRKKKKH